MRKIFKPGGAVSVFLVIILVPSILAASIFVDLGRVHMSRELATSSADLALNSLMTSYDSDLSEWYGLVASCQSIEEFYAVSEEYFLKAIASKNLSDSDLILVSDQFSKLGEGEKIADLLQAECQSEKGKMIKEVENANLSNAAMMKTQIVEFMKYRAPIELTEGLLKRIQEAKEAGGMDNIMNAKANEELIERKSEYYEAESELMEKAYNTYLAIRAYETDAAKNDMTAEKLGRYADRLRNYRESYEQIHQKLIQNLYNTEGLSVYERVNRKSIKSEIKRFRARDVASGTREEPYTVEVSDGNGGTTTETRTRTIYYIDESDFSAAIRDAGEAVEEVERVARKYSTNEAIKRLLAKLPGEGESDAYTVQWQKQAVDALEKEGLQKEMEKAAAKLFSEENRLKAIGGLDEIEARNESSRRRKALQEIEQAEETYLTVGEKGSEPYQKFICQLEEQSKKNEKMLTPEGNTVNVEGRSMNLVQALAAIQANLNSMERELKGYVEQLNTAIDGDSLLSGKKKYERVVSLDKLKELADEYQTAYTAWDETSQKTYKRKTNELTDLAKENREEIKALQKNEAAEKINEESVKELKERLVNIRTQYESYLKAIEKMKYGKEKLGKIGSYAQLKKAAKREVRESEIKLTNGELKAYAEKTFAKLFEPEEPDKGLRAHLKDSKYDPYINPESGKNDTPALYIWLHQKFKGTNAADIREQQEAMDKTGKKTEDKQKEIQEKSRYHGKGSDISAEYSKAAAFSLGEGILSAAADLLESLEEGDYTAMRDELYVSTYVTKMLSYGTYDREGRYRLLDSGRKKGCTSKNAESMYESVKGKWASKKTTDTYNKSLTNKLINNANNAAYEAEAEYILYGKKNEESIKAAYSDIFWLRYPLNLVSGHQNFWTYTMGSPNTTAGAIDTIARTVSILTQYIVPAAAVKVVLIALLTVFETGEDLNRLEAGLPVELYKKDYTEWQIRLKEGMKSIAAALSAIENAQPKGNPGTGLYYSDYIGIFLYLGLKTDSADAMYERIGEVLQTNIRKMSGKSDYSMKKARSYFKLEAKIRVKPLMLALPIFDSVEGNIKEKTDWCTYNIKMIRGYS